MQGGEEREETAGLRRKRGSLERGVEPDEDSVRCVVPSRLPAVPSLQPDEPPPHNSSPLSVFSWAFLVHSFLDPTPVPATVRGSSELP